MPQMKCESGTAVQHKLIWHRRQFEPQSLLRGGENFQMRPKLLHSRNLP